MSMTGLPRRRAPARGSARCYAANDYACENDAVGTWKPDPEGSVVALVCESHLQGAAKNGLGRVKRFRRFGPDRDPNSVPS
jgi:hypothetical protein